MFNKISVNLLLKSVISTLAVAVMIALSLSAWQFMDPPGCGESDRGCCRGLGLSVHGAAQSADRSLEHVYRDLNSDKQTDGRWRRCFKEIRDADMPALKSALVALQVTRLSREGKRDRQPQ